MEKAKCEALVRRRGHVRRTRCGKPARYTMVIENGRLTARRAVAGGGLLCKRHAKRLEEPKTTILSPYIFSIR